MRWCTLGRMSNLKLDHLRLICYGKKYQWPLEAHCAVLRLKNQSTLRNEPRGSCYQPSDSAAQWSRQRSQGTWTQYWSTLQHQSRCTKVATLNRRKLMGGGLLQHQKLEFHPGKVLEMGKLTRPIGTSRIVSDVFTGCVVIGPMKDGSEHWDK